MMDKGDMIILSALLIGGMLLGWFGNNIYTSWSDEIKIKGLWFSNWNNITQVKEEAYSLDSSGEWVCVNVNKDSDYKEVYDTCIHECSHSAYSELFARKCEDNPIKCEEIINNGVANDV